ncbi:uncharacterized protein BKCO1_6200048 [Diplodia corticola]|uniref:Uncharacterized protein n=1 Tax=Diplodia corticola TaxID=236234 RepID=A0A1J9RPD4_9PEZI|nr:uncharacterized protein BKCO1_6200048 [Diplodia corticola]OJD30327.1 hypothetical protein BKCO1_6200048 [Diplodia corticola]
MQGFNMGRYYAPSTSAAPTFNNTSSSHPLGARARKLRSSGALVVRFEMPFAVWCDGCGPAPALIGQGVRFNAEKRRVGAHHSTPVWEFAMRHAACGGSIVVRTDPARAEYVVVSGGRRRDYGGGDKGGKNGGEEAEGEYYEGLLGEGGGGGRGEILAPEEVARRKGDAMAALEGRKGEKEKKAWEESRVEELRRMREKDWADPYAANKKLRKPFREMRKEREKEEGVKEELQERFGLGLEIVDEREEDRRRAKLIDFGDGDARDDGDVDAAALKAASRPLFGEEAPSNALPTQKTKGKTKAQRAAELSRQTLQQKLKGNTRAAMDPFSAEKTRIGPPTIAGIKRKRAVTTGDLTDSASRDTTPESPFRPNKAPSERKTLALVDYGSDDE